MNDVVIKICGITSFKDGMAALDHGADWLGFIRWPKSKRFRPIEETSAMLAQLRDAAPRPFQSVGVYVDSEIGLIKDEIDTVGFDRIQLHGNETPDFAGSFSLPTIKALRVHDPATIMLEARAFGSLDLLIDAFDPDNPGGTGIEHDYGALAPLIRARRVIVAGGLHPGNVGDMVKRLRPWGVDVSSGVESAPGVKDHDLVRAFIRNARAANA